MNNRFWISLSLAAALAVPALAQNSAPSKPADQPPAATADQPQAPDAAAAEKTTSSRQPLNPEPHEGFWGHLNPFARKKYVQRNLQPVRDRVSELDDLTAANSKAIKDVDGRATEGIRIATNRVNEADQHALEAGNRAQMAHQTAQQANTRLTSLSQTVSNFDQYKVATEAEIHFRPGQVALSQKAKDALDEIATPLKDQKGYIVEVQGFAPGKGITAVESSQKMAESVVRYLVIEHQIPVYRIFTMGMGNVPVQASAGETKAKQTRGGRVEISLLKNGLDQLDTQVINPQGDMNAQTSAASAAKTSSATSPAAPPPAQQPDQSETSPK